MISKHDFKLYNLIFPFWILYFFPPFIFVAILGNFIIDASIIYYTVKSNRIYISNKNYSCTYFLLLCSDLLLTFLVRL